MGSRCITLTDLTLAAPQIVEGGSDGAEEQRVRPGDPLPACPPQLRTAQVHDSRLCSAPSPGSADATGTTHSNKYGDVLEPAFIPP